MDKAVRFGIIGFGNMGTGHGRSFRDGKIGDGVLAAVADIDPGRLKNVSDYGEGIAVYNSGEELIEKSDVDAVIIATPHYLHPPLAVAALKRGFNVVCEKPAGVYTKQVKEMNEAAKTAKGLFTVMFNQRTNPVYRKMREIILSGGIGTIKRVNWIITDWYRTQAYYNSGGWRATWDGEGGGVLLNQCPHNLDLLQWICGLPCRVRAFCHNGKWHQIEVEDDVTAYLEFPNGATGVFVTTTADAPGTNRFEITLERGKLVAEHDKLTFFELEQSERDFCFTATGGFEQPAGHEVTIELDGKNPQHVGVLNAFAGAILRGEPLVADGTEGIRGLELSNAMHLSSWTDQTVTLPIDEALFLEKLNEHRKASKVKTEVTEVTFDTSDSYGSKVSDNTDKGGVKA